MTHPILPDTDVLVDYLRGRKNAVTLIQSCADRIILSSIAVAELYAGVKGENEEAALNDFVSLFRVVPVTQTLAQTGGFLKRDYGKSHGIGLADAIIAATVLAEHAELKTLNIKHYPMFEGLRPAYDRPRPV